MLQLPLIEKTAFTIPMIWMKNSLKNKRKKRRMMILFSILKKLIKRNFKTKRINH